jgi:leucyl/phenylalanyl-tRNA--protein transferase
MRLTPALLLRAYAAGVFPMARDAADPELLWFDPDPRAILPLDGLHVPRRLARTARQAPYALKVDIAFEAVLTKCGPARPETTWINAEIFATVLELHRLGFAHSVEAWRGDELVGGLYGIALGGAFFGESMFSTATDASKLCLLHLVERLNARGFTLLDVQFVNDHLKQFGIIEISQAEYHRRLEAALVQTVIF